MAEAASNKIIFDRLLILGVGLMGGSLALAAKQAGVVNQVIGWSRRESTLATALSSGVIDIAEADLTTALKMADCVVVATPTILAESLMIKVLEQVDVRVVVTDVASVKGNIAKALSERFGSIPSNAVLGHPIAGSEQSGVAAANVALYRDHKVILIRDDETDESAFAKLSALWQATGAEVQEMGAAEHDRVLALTSHLPHVLAFALVGQLAANKDNDAIFEFAAGGFRDFTRIASSDPRMWAEIVVANKSELINAIAGFQDQLGVIVAMLEADADMDLESLFTNVKQQRDEFVAALAARQSP